MVREFLMFTMKTVPSSVEALLEKANLTKDDIEICGISSGK